MTARQSPKLAVREHLHVVSQGILGGPEKPISDLGKKGYKRFWAGEIARWILGMDLTVTAPPPQPQPPTQAQAQMKGPARPQASPRATER